MSKTRTDHDVLAARSPIAEDREWWPDELLDEVMPPGKPSPTDWIIGPAGDVYAIGDPDDPEADDGGVLKRMRPGDVARFSYCDRLGDVEVTFAADGTFTAHGPVPEAANWCRIANDQDTLHDDLPALARWIAAERPELLGEQTVQFARWAHEDLAFTLEIDAVDHRPRFVFTPQRERN